MLWGLFFLLAVGMLVVVVVTMVHESRVDRENARSWNAALDKVRDSL
ncbi:membrane protein [Microbacterium phage Zooman]|nr:membrane protein [Microbacterium phage Zooman]